MRSLTILQLLLWFSIFFVFFDAPYHCVWSSHERGKWFHMTLLWLWPCITYSGVAGEDWHRRSEGVLKVEKSPDETDEKKSFKKVPLDRKASKFAWLMAEEGFFSPKVLESDARHFSCMVNSLEFLFSRLTILGASVNMVFGIYCTR